MELATNYMGLELRNPLVASASPLSHTVDGVRRLADAGVGAIVLHSLFEEQLREEAELNARLADAGTESFAESLSYFPSVAEEQTGPGPHLDLLQRAAAAVDIPVIGNGDIKTAEDAVRLQRETGCAAIMIARGSFGQPWIFDQTRALLEGKPKPEAPPIERRFEIALEHAHMAEEYEADPRGAAIEFRKHLGWYVKGVPGSAELRRKLHAVVTLSEVEDPHYEHVCCLR